MGGSCDRIGATVGIKLGNPRVMELGGMHQDSQPPRNYLVGGAIGYGGEHLALARRDPARAGLVQGLLRCG